MVVRNRRAGRPQLERLEGRDLLSAIIALEASQATPVPSAIDVIEARTAGASGSSGGGGNSGGGSAGRSGSTPIASPGVGINAYSGNTGGAGNGNTLANNATSPLLGNGLPSPSERAREAFRASFSGRVYTGQGRFSDQGTTYYFRGLGGSNMFLHGDFNMAVITPTDPTAPFLGEAVLNDKSTNSNGSVGFILGADRTAVDSQGRPTQLTFEADPNVYSGIFANDAAQGTVTIKYGAHNAITATFQGLVYTSGLTSPLVNSDLYARNGRPLPFHSTTNLAKVGRHRG